MSLQNKTILVTGGSRGIGRAVVLELAERGANVAFTYRRDADSARSVEKLALERGANATGYQLDVRSQSDAEWLVQLLDLGRRGLDGLVNNAGIRMDRTLLHMSETEWSSVIDTNLNGVFRLTRTVLPAMQRRRRGRIVNINSVSGINGLAGQSNYAAAKAGVIGFTKALAKEAALFGVSVNAIAPGPVDTEMLDGLDPKQMQRLLQGVPMRRLCTAAEVAMLTAFLLDEALSPAYLTAQAIALDGGMGL